MRYINSMGKKKEMRINMKFLIDLLKGMVVGIANIIPGVSGGTMMVSMGIYEKIIGAINNLFKHFKQSILTLIPIGIGMVAGIGVFSYILPYCLENQPLPTSLCFIGLILGGVPFIVKPAKDSLKKDGKHISLQHVTAFLILFGIAVAMAFMSETESHSASFNLNALLIVKLFIIGVIASATMVVPGVSGSLVLMLLGYYSGIIETIRDFIDSLIAFNAAGILHCVGILLPFGIGVVVGIFAVSKLIEWLFEKHPSVTYSAILGLILASPIGILAKMGHNNINAASIIVGIVLLAGATWFTYWFGKKTENIEE